jgi:CelD/BcsL family acetyltransferase involved in cellulose biosynthesis
MIVERIETTAGFAALRDEWGALLKMSSSKCIFLTHEWLFTWWKHFAAGRSLFILTVRDNGKLVGILPLALTRAHYSRMIPRSLQFLGSGLIGSDYLDAIVSPGAENEVGAAFSEHLFRLGIVLHLSSTPRAPSIVRQLSAHLCGRGWTLVDTATNVCPYIRLSGQTWAGYLSSLGSSQRYNFNRRLKNLQKNHTLTIENARTPEQAQPALDIVIRLHRLRWTVKGESEAFNDANTVAFHREFVDLAAAEGWLRILVTRIDGMPAAALYGWRYGETFYFYQSGFDPEWSRQSIGLVTMGLAIQSAIEEGAGEYDFLHGAEEYKSHWASETREIGRLELYPDHSRGRLSRRVVEFNRTVRRVAKQMLDKTA